MMYESKLDHGDKAKANATTTKAKTKTNAKEDKKKRGTSSRISTATSVKASAIAPKKTGIDAWKKKEKAKHQHSPRHTDIHRNKRQQAFTNPPPHDRPPQLHLQQ